MKRFIYLVSIFLIFCCSSAIAEISINATVDKTEATLEDMIELSVTVSGISGGSEPELPPLPDFQVQSRGTSSSIQIINGQMNSSVSYNYSLLPKKTGEFIVAPVILKHKGQAYQSEPFSIKITAASSSPSSDPEGIFVTAEVSNARPYLYEQIIYTFRFYRRVQTGNPHLQLPNFDKFWKEELGKQNDYEKVINGQNFLVTEIKFAIFPSSSGKVIIDPITLQVDVLQAVTRRQGNDPLFDRFFNDPFFRNNVVTKQKILRSKPIELEILPIPEYGRPDHYKNIVGELTISSDISKKELKVGETVTLTVKISGDGNVKDINLPPVDNNNDFKVYDDKPVYSKSPKDDRLFGEIVLKRSLVPLHDGDIKTPQIDIPYFNTKNKRYEVLKVPSVILKVIPSGEDEKLEITGIQPENVSRSKVKILANDLLDIHTDLNDFYDHRFTSGQIVLYLIIFLSPMIGFVSILIYSRHSEKMKGNIGYFRRRTAYKKGAKRLEDIKSLLKGSDQKGFYAELSKLLREYIGDKLNLQGVAFTSIDVEQRLIGKGFPQELTTDIKRILEKCELAQYATSSGLSDNPEDLLKKTGELIRNMEEYL